MRRIRIIRYIINKIPTWYKVLLLIAFAFGSLFAIAITMVMIIFSWGAF